MNDLRISKDFVAYSGEEIISNFDGIIITETARAIKNKNLYSTYPGWNFYGTVWFQDNMWNCEIWCYDIYQETYTELTLEKLKEMICEKYGYQ